MMGELPGTCTVADLCRFEIATSNSSRDDSAFVSMQRVPLEAIPMRFQNAVIVFTST